MSVLLLFFAWILEQSNVSKARRYTLTSLDCPRRLDRAHHGELLTASAVTLRQLTDTLPTGRHQTSWKKEGCCRRATRGYRWQASSQEGGIRVDKEEGSRSFRSHPYQQDLQRGHQRQLEEAIREWRDLRMRATKQDHSNQPNAD